MQDLNKAVSQNKKLYRELFLNSKESLDNQINSLKYKSYCNKCNACCKTRYFSFSPEKLKVLACQDDSIKYFIKYFIPYGASQNYDYSFDIDLKENNETAKKQDEPYVSKVLDGSGQDVYFYTCRFLKDGKCCADNKNINVCFNFPENIEKLIPDECGYKSWHENVVKLLENTIAKEIVMKLNEIKDHRNNFECKKTATCCKFASSEFSYEELKQKAKNNDNFASQFVSIFIPYEDEKKAREVYPEYFDFIKTSISENEKAYFYYCKHIKDGTLCPIYEDRPQICRDFPDNPLSFLPPTCGFCKWKDETEVQTLICHSVISLIEYYLDLLK